MKLIVGTTPQEIKNEHENITSISSPVFDDMPKAHNPHAGENKVVYSLDKINVMLERYRQAVGYVDWFEFNHSIKILFKYTILGLIYPKMVYNIIIEEVPTCK